MKEIELTQEEIDIIYLDVLIKKQELQYHFNVDDYITTNKLTLCDSILRKLE